MYGLQQPPIYESVQNFSMNSWYQRIARYVTSRTKLTTLTTDDVVNADIFAVRADATAAAIAVTLPEATLNGGRQLFVKKIDASGNAVIVTAAGSDLIDGAATFPLAAQYDAVLLFCNGTGWDIISTY